MKRLIIIITILFPLISMAQERIQKLSKDSVRYYQNQLRELYKSTYDSLKNSIRFNEINQRLNQNAKNTSDNFGVELTFFTGLQVNNYSNLNERLSSLNVKEKKTLLLPVGVGLAFRFNKIIVGYDMTPILLGDNSSGAYIHGYLSTNIIKTKQWVFSPQIGYGGQNVTVRVPTQSTSTNFNSYFTASANQVELRHSNPVLDFALALKLYPQNRDTYIPLFRVGYRYGLKEEAWEVRNGNSTNSPIDRNNNFYIQLMFGFGD